MWGGLKLVLGGVGIAVAMVAGSKRIAFSTTTSIRDMKELWMGIRSTKDRDHFGGDGSSSNHEFQPCQGPSWT